MRTGGRVLSTQYSGGFSLLELAIVICIAAVLMGTFLDRILFYQEKTEKTAMVGVVAALQSALTMQYARLLVQGKESGIAALAADNPMNWLAEKPPNYAGEFYDPQPGAIAPGKWAFDLKTHELVYVPEHTARLIFSGHGRKWVRYRVNLTWSSAPNASSTEKLGGVSLVPVEPYRWEM